MAFEYFTRDSSYDVVAFSVEAAYLKEKTLFGKPIVPFEELAKQFPPSRFRAFVAVTSTQLNRVRRRFYESAKQQGYRFVSYVSSRAFVWHNVKIGENSFVFENNVLQYHVEIGNNVVLWSGNHIGHRTQIADHCFLSSHVVISGFCRIGESCFLGVNSCVADGVAIAADNCIGAGAVIIRPTEKGKVYVGNPARALSESSYAKFKVSEPRA